MEQELASNSFDLKKFLHEALSSSVSLQKHTWNLEKALQSANQRIELLASQNYSHFVEQNNTVEEIKKELRRRKKQVENLLSQSKRIQAKLTTPFTQIKENIKRLEVNQATEETVKRCYEFLVQLKKLKAIAQSESLDITKTVRILSTVEEIGNTPCIKDLHFVMSEMRSVQNISNRLRDITEKDFYNAVAARNKRQIQRCLEVYNCTGDLSEKVVQLVNKRKDRIITIIKDAIDEDFIAVKIRMSFEEIKDITAQIFILTDKLDAKDPYTYQTFSQVLQENKFIDNLFIQYWLHLVGIVQSRLKELTTYDNYVTSYPQLAKIFLDFWNGLCIECPQLKAAKYSRCEGIIINSFSDIWDEFLTETKDCFVDDLRNLRLEPDEIHQFLSSKLHSFLDECQAAEIQEKASVLVEGIVQMLLIEIKGKWIMDPSILSSPLEPLNKEQLFNLQLWNILADIHRVTSSWPKKLFLRATELNTIIDNVLASLLNLVFSQLFSLCNSMDEEWVLQINRGQSFAYADKMSRAIRLFLKNFEDKYDCAKFHEELKKFFWEKLAVSKLFSGRQEDDQSIFSLIYDYYTARGEQVDPGMEQISEMNLREVDDLLEARNAIRESLRSQQLVPWLSVLQV